MWATPAQELVGADHEGLSLVRPERSATETRAAHAEQQNEAVAHMTQKYEQELAGKAG